MYKKKLNALMSDFKYYGFALLCVGVFLYVGILIPGSYHFMNSSNELFKQHMLMGTTCLLLAGSLSCFLQSIKYNKLLHKEAE